MHLHKLVPLTKKQQRKPETGIKNSGFEEIEHVFCVWNISNGKTGSVHFQTFRCSRKLPTETTCKVPRVPEAFLAYDGNFWCWPKAETPLAVGRSHDLTETGNCARKISGTQGT